MENSHIVTELKIVTESRKFVAYVKYGKPDKDTKYSPIERCKAAHLGGDRLVHFEYVVMDRDSEVEQVFSETYRRGLRPAVIEEFRAFIRRYPGEHVKYPIAAFGSETYMNDERCFPVSWNNSDGQHRSLGWYGDGTRIECCFLAVRE